jgi:aldehyde:ferredoxin oxidoreductase
MNGYMGRLLVVDLSNGQIKEEKLNPEYTRDFLGGSGLAARYLYDIVDADVDPLGPANPLIFMTGPLVGTSAPSCGRHVVCARSPLTGIWGEANSGGFFGAELRFAGYDGLVFTGRADEPTYLSIVNGQAALHDASALWGLDTYETQARVKQALGEPKARVACIGPAGEKEVLYAAVMNDHGRAAGRTGMGAVMGSKNLKAIAVRGKPPIPLADPQTFQEVAREATRFVRDDFVSVGFREGGTAIGVEMTILMGDAPAKYWTEGKYEEAAELSGSVMADTILIGPAACYRCPIACGRRVSLQESKYQVKEVDGPEYETVISLGSLVLSNNLKDVAYAGHLCNLYGIDTISAGSTIALAYYLYEQGVITSADTGGLPLNWGDMDTVIALVELIGRREGFGDALAQGAQRLAARFGAPDLAVHVKGLEMPMHDPRAYSGMAVTYATSPRGACHLQSDMYMIDMGMEVPELGILPSGRFKTRGKSAVTARHQNWRSLYNAMIMCHFANPPVTSVVALLGAATGWERSPHEWQQVGERIFTLQRALNNRLGVRRGDDRLPQLVLRPISGGTMGRTPRMDKLMEAYYAYRRWDWESGKPSREKLIALGLDQIAQDLWG